MNGADTKATFLLQYMVDPVDGQWQQKLFYLQAYANVVAYWFCIDSIQVCPVHETCAYIL